MVALSGLVFRGVVLRESDGWMTMACGLCLACSTSLSRLAASDCPVLPSQKFRLFFVVELTLLIPLAAYTEAWWEVEGFGVILVFRGGKDGMHRIFADRCSLLCFVFPGRLQECFFKEL